MSDVLLSREFFDRPATTVAPELLGCVLEHQTAEGLVAVRLSEVEAYSGEADPASHAYRGRTKRNEAMYGNAGHAYVYFTYGMHWCMNLVCLSPGIASAVLLRAGAVIRGVEIGRSRRRLAADGSRDRDLARGPARLTQVLAVERTLDGSDVCDPEGNLRIRPGQRSAAGRVRTGPRTGVAAAQETPWRYYVDGEPSVSPYRSHARRTSRTRRS